MRLNDSSTIVAQSDSLENQRRAHNTIIIASGMSLLCAIFLPAAWSEHAALEALALLAGAVVLFLSGAVLARAGHVRLATLIVIGVSIVTSLGLIVLNPTTPSLPFFLILAILLASVLLPPAQIWAVLPICLVSNFLAHATFSPERRADPIWFETLSNSSLLMIGVALIGYLGARSIRVAMHETQTARAEAEAAIHNLAASNALLETRVEERTSALHQIADEYRAAAAELKTSLQAQQALDQLVAEMSIPVIPIRAGTLVVPLVGNIDSQRADQILSTILSHVERAHAHTVVLDVTGIAMIDTHVAAGLLRVVQATRLMGAQTILAGIRPEVAQSLVGLGADLSDLHTVATLQELDQL
ncbi:MAG: STAS domain-containing protein [Chloroflexales bacterium]